MNEWSWSAWETSTGKYSSLLPTFSYLSTMFLSIPYLFIYEFTALILTGQLLHERCCTRICARYPDEWKTTHYLVLKEDITWADVRGIQKDLVFRMWPFFIDSLFFSLRVPIKHKNPLRRISKLAIMKEKPGCSIWKSQAAVSEKPVTYRSCSNHTICKRVWKK